MRRPPLYALFELIGYRRWLARLYRVELRHAERIPAEGPAILVANHESLLDPWLLGLATRRPIRFMAKAELWRSPLVGRVMDAFGTFPVQRGAGDRAALGRAEQLLEAGELLAIFPQGTVLPYRHRPWLRGAARLAIATGTTIVPVCIVGSEKALRPRKPRLGLPRIQLIVCEPTTPTAARPTIEAARALTERLRASIEDAHAPFGPPAHAWYPDERSA